MTARGARGLPFRNWPEADQMLWRKLVQTADPFGESGPLSGLRKTSLETLQNGYGFFLRHLQRSGMDLDRTPPGERASVEWLRSYHASLAGLAPYTKAGYFAALTQVLTAAFPDRDWKPLRRARDTLCRIARRAGGTRDKSIVPLATELLDLGQRLGDAGMIADQPRRRAELWRDGLMIRILIRYPMRLRNFAELEMGRTLKATATGFMIDLPAEDTKSHRPVSVVLDRETADLVQVYLKEIRPMFPGGHEPGAGRLWLRFSRGPWEKKAIGRHISRLCEDGLGRRVTPHLFRDAAATTVAVSEGCDARIIRPLLTHVRASTSEKHYIQAGQIDAGRLYHRALTQILESGR